MSVSLFPQRSPILWYTLRLPCYGFLTWYLRLCRVVDLGLSSDVCVCVCAHKQNTNTHIVVHTRVTPYTAACPVIGLVMALSGR